jgi:hypothetical protein
MAEQSIVEQSTMQYSTAKIYVAVLYFDVLWFNVISLITVRCPVLCSAFFRWCAALCGFSPMLCYLIPVLRLLSHSTTVLPDILQHTLCSTAG